MQTPDVTNTEVVRVNDRVVPILAAGGKHHTFSLTVEQSELLVAQLNQAINWAKQRIVPKRIIKRKH
jgi:hypothetical protein